MNSNEKIEIVADTEIADTNTDDDEAIESKSTAQGLPDYEEATESKCKDELESRSQTPTEIFAATESSTYPPPPVVNQPQTVQPAGHHVRIHPAPMVAVVAPVAPAIHTSCCECDGPWCDFCCCGVFCHPCTGLSLNLKLTGKSGMWGWDILACMVFGIFGFLFWVSFLFWFEGETKVLSIIALVTSIILLMILVVRIYNRFVQRRLFLQKQARNGHSPNNEGCIVSFLCTLFCSPCMFGQMNSAIEKQRLLSSIQPPHTVSYA